MRVRMREHTFRSESEIHWLKEFPGNPVAIKVAVKLKRFLQTQLLSNFHFHLISAGVDGVLAGKNTKKVTATKTKWFPMEEAGVGDGCIYV